MMIYRISHTFRHSAEPIYRGSAPHGARVAGRSKAGAGLGGGRNVTKARPREATVHFSYLNIAPSEKHKFWNHAHWRTRRFGEADLVLSLVAKGDWRCGIIYDQTGALLARITVDPEVFAGKPIIRGKRLAVEHVLADMAAGETQDAILANFPFLEHADIQACLLFAARIVGGSYQSERTSAASAD
jgi:uncharacterized protein (DUF433 family)